MELLLSSVERPVDTTAFEGLARQAHSGELSPLLLTEQTEL